MPLLRHFCTRGDFSHRIINHVWLFEAWVKKPGRESATSETVPVLQTFLQFGEGIRNIRDSASIADIPAVLGRNPQHQRQCQYPIKNLCMVQR